MPVKSFHVETAAWIDRYVSGQRLRSSQNSVVKGEQVTLFARLTPFGTGLTASGTPTIQIINEATETAVSGFESPVNVTSHGAEANALLAMHTLDVTNFTVGQYRAIFAMTAVAGADGQTKRYQPVLKFSVIAK